MGFTDFINMIFMLLSFMPPIVTLIITVGIVILIVLAVKRTIIS